MKRRLKSIFALLLVLIMLAGCGTSSTTAPKGTDNKATTKKDTLTVVIPVDVASLFQWETDDTWALSVLNHIVDPLWRSSPKDAELTGALAEKWEISPDYKEVKVKLREGVKFHNGDPLTTKDVKYTLEEAIKQPWCTRWRGTLKSVEIIDDLNCIIRWEKGDPNNIKGFTLPLMSILPADYIAKVGFEGYKKNPIGTGPFIFESWERGNRIVFKANKEYFDGAPTYDKLIVRMITDSNAALMALESGEVDVVCDLKPTFKETVDKNKNLRWEQTASSMYIYIQVNNLKKPFDDPRVRKALSMAINREQLQAVALGGGGLMVPYGITPYSPQWSDKDPMPKYDPEGAKKLLAEAGFPNGMEVTLTCRQGDFQKPASEVVQSNWEAIGVKTNVAIMERNAQMNDLIAGNYQLGWQQTTDYLSDAKTWGMANDSNYWGGKGANRSFYKNERFDELDSLQMYELDPNKRLEYFEEMKQIYFKDTPNIPGFFAPTTCVVNKDLKNTYASITNFYRFDWFSWE